MKRLLKHALLLFVIVLAACNTPATAPPTQVVSATPESSPTPSPTETPTPLPGKALIAGDPANQALEAEAIQLLEGMAAPVGLTVERVESLTVESLTPEVKLVVSLRMPADLPALMAAAPQAQFVVISPTPLEPAGNLSVIHLQAEHQAFIAGLVGVIISTDWRAAGLIAAETPNLQDAFANGGRYYCGDCMPGWPLTSSFPLVAGAPAPADGPSWQAVAANFFDNGKAEVFYLSPEAMRSEVIDYLSGLIQFNTTVKVLGALPPPNALQTQWAATVGFDPLQALQEVLPEALAGKSAGSVSVPVTLSHINENILSPGRQLLVEQYMQELAKGLISPLSVPAEP